VATGAGPSDPVDRRASTYHVAMSMGCALLDQLPHRTYNAGDAHVVELEITDEIRGPVGAVHGGLIASLVDRAGAYAAVQAGGRSVVTSTVSLSYLAAATTGPLRAAAVPLRVGRRQGVIEVRVHDRGLDDLLVATALLTLSFVSADTPLATTAGSAGSGP
jgi:uncharacterized protein (TIGR00369 family)